MNFKGIQLGVDPVPIDDSILESMKQRFNIDESYARKCIQANKHNHVSASYYLLFKEKIKAGEKSNADVRQPDYNAELFVHTAKSLKREKVKDKLENTSIQIEEEEFEDLKNNKVKPESSKERSKSQQPQRLRKIADGLMEFERYADRKKRLENVQKKNQ